MLTEASARALELPAFLRTLAQMAATDLGRRRITELEPLSSRQAIERRQSLLREVDEVLEEITLVPSLEEPIQPLVLRLTEGDGSLLGAELMLLAAALDVPRIAAESLRKQGLEAPLLMRSFAADPVVGRFCDRVRRSLDRRGRVRDDASPELGRLRRRIQKVRSGLYQSLQQALDDNREHFAETTISLKDGRLSLLLNAGAKGRQPGIIHGRSGTGQSLYFEPIEAVDANNTLQDALEAEAEERQRILNELIDEARANLALIRSQLDVLADLDLLQAASRLAQMGDCALPILSAPGDLQLRQARHPLLEPAFSDLRLGALGTAGHTDSVVPLDLDLDPDRRVLVITGPNAGGKTVALKTTGLLTLIAQCGLPIPAREGSRVPVCTGFMAMVGDEQDLLSDRSTFSARLLRLKEAWEVAAPSSLVLLDELGSGTDPEEGAALAIALLEGLLERDTLGVITTHLTQLSAVALERPGAVCAAMEFDPESGEPTYRLRPGAPGASEALALAERLGLPSAWIERAETLLGGEHRDLRRLLQEVEKVRLELADTQGRLALQSRELEQERVALAEELEKLTDERKHQAGKMRRRLDEFKRKVSNQLRDELEAMRLELDRGRRKGLVAESAERLFESAPEIDEVEEASGEVEIGERVRHRSMGWEGVLEKVQDDAAEIRVGGKRIHCSLDDLFRVDDSGGSEDEVSKVQVHVRKSEATDPESDEINLLGLRVEPALAELDRRLDRALLNGRRELRIVHGFGSGRLRKAVRSHLEPHPAVARFRAGKSNEGGDGATIAILGND